MQVEKAEGLGLDTDKQQPYMDYLKTNQPSPEEYPPEQSTNPTMAYNPDPNTQLMICEEPTTNHVNQKRKTSPSPCLHNVLFKSKKITYLEAVHAAMGKISLQQPIIVSEHALSDTQTEEMAMEEERVVITYKRLIHVKRQVRNRGDTTGTSRVILAIEDKKHEGETGHYLSP